MRCGLLGRPFVARDPGFEHFDALRLGLHERLGRFGDIGGLRRCFGSAIEFVSPIFALQRRPQAVHA